MDTLNPPQREAVLHDKGPLRVLAGAGSGKTRVVTQRIARLIKNGASPSSILAVTFTNKAAGEMRERVGRLVGTAIAKKLVIGTFHSFGARFLRQEIATLGYPSAFSIFDPGDQLAVIRQVMIDIGADERRHDPRDLLNRIALAKAACIPPNQLRPGGDPNSVAASKAFPRYVRALRTMGAVDFEDLIYLPVVILQQNATIRDAWRRKFEYLMVDEYQDTNRAQLELVRLLAGEDGNLFVVGDDDQSIYGWRGADHTNILEFQRHFPGARTVFLTQNYRSTGPILGAANSVIKKNVSRMDKELWTELEGGEPVRFVRCSDEDEEAAFVADDIERRRIEEGRHLGDFAILYRTNAQARPFEEHLRANNIEYQVIGGVKFYDRKEIKDLVAYLRLLVNPKDEICLRRVINYPSRGIGESSMEALLDHAANRSMTFWNACKEVDHVAGISPKAATAVREFVAIIEAARSTLHRDGPHATASQLVKDIGLIEELSRSNRSERVAIRRIENIRSVLNTLERHEETANDPSLNAFVAKISLETRNEEPDDEAEADEVTLMTLHSAKGLEFPVVYLVGMEEGLLPYRHRVGAALAPLRESELAEERRLCYVGMTRARESLTLTASRLRRVRGQNIPSEPSRFLREVPTIVTTEKSSSPGTAPKKGPGAAQKRRKRAEDEFFKQIKELF